MSTPTRPTIALAMIVKNEAHNLPRLFKSIEGCFDEIVITDTGSTDDTVKIAEEHGARVEHFTWVNDFAAARNYSFSKCNSDYIMWLDGDDVLTNREDFINFRDNIMMLADFWIADYNYATNDAGKVVCKFIRERVIKNGLGIKWQYFVHEGMIPKSEVRQPKINITPSFSVTHCRTQDDLNKDKGRNLKLFEVNKKLDSRMRYYYGKELFEASRPIEAIEQLGIALSQTDLEMHDRMLAYQYICYAYMQVNRFEKAIEMSNTAIILDPNRAELWTILADSFLKLGRLADAIPLYHAAMSCIRNGQNNPIFQTEQAYTNYPRNQLARIYAQMGDFEKAQKYSDESLKVSRDVGLLDEETKLLNAEIGKIRHMSTAYKHAHPCEDIVISTIPQAPYLWDANIAKEKSMGGSETAAIEMAKHLHKLSGRNVKIFNPRLQFGGLDTIIDGVEYIDIGKLPQYFADHKPWLHIAWRHNNKLTDARTFLWCHDLVTQGAENTANYEKIFCLTPFHKNFVKAMQKLPDEKIHVTRNGIMPERFKDGPWEKDPNMFVFSSSPDRGLDRAMRVLDKVREKHPDIKLHVFYGIEHLPKYGLQALHDELKLMMEERKDWVIYHGATQQDELMRQFKRAAYCVQPSDFIETSMISAMERLLCGVYQIIRAVGGCVDTLKEAGENGHATLVHSECITELEYGRYVEATLKAIEEQAYKRIQVDPDKYAWELVAKEWLEYFNQEVKKSDFEVFKRIG